MVNNEILEKYYNSLTKCSLKLAKGDTELAYLSLNMTVQSILRSSNKIETFSYLYESLKNSYLYMRKKRNRFNKLISFYEPAHIDRYNSEFCYLNITKDLRYDILQDLLSTDEKCTSVIRYMIEHDLSLAETSRRLNLNENTVKSHYNLFIKKSRLKVKNMIY